MIFEEWFDLSDIKDDHLIWSGTLIRVYLDSNPQKYYDYIISEIFNNQDYFQLTCISSGKAGYILCVLKIESSHQKAATGKELQKMLSSPCKTLVCFNWKD